MTIDPDEELRRIEGSDHVPEEVSWVMLAVGAIIFCIPIAWLIWVVYG